MVATPDLSAKNPTEARHVKRFGGETIGLNNVSQGFVFRRPRARNSVSRLSHFSYVPGHNDFFDRLRGGLHRCTKTMPLLLRVAEEIVSRVVQLTNHLIYRKEHPMGNSIADLFKSKKALTAMAAVIVGLAAKLGLDISTDELLPILSPLMAYIVGQGIADHGKERAKVEKA